ncbi:hypothetical protein ACRALDRAFT_2039270 [Sodiomyces alcalophilus JCM 7366]|uniref:uncharacterized protein n=1 Tax=Sodiomyces alcalophilus JCM 7366 TaxID=591952 RepID=UPI0039B59015
MALRNLDHENSHLEKGLATGPTDEKGALLTDDTNTTRSDLEYSLPSPRRSTAAKIASACRFVTTFLVCFLLAFGLTTAALPPYAGRGGQHHPHDGRAGAQQQDDVGVHPLMGSCQPNLLHRLLHAYLPERFRDGAYPSDEDALSAVGAHDPELATKLAQLAKRQDGGGGGNETDAASDVSSPSVPVPSPTDSDPPVVTATSEEPTSASPTDDDDSTTPQPPSTPTTTATPAPPPPPSSPPPPPSSISSPPSPPPPSSSDDDDDEPTTSTTTDARPSPTSASTSAEPSESGTSSSEESSTSFPSSSPQPSTPSSLTSITTRTSEISPLSPSPTPSPPPTTTTTLISSESTSQDSETSSNASDPPTTTSTPRTTRTPTSSSEVVSTSTSTDADGGLVLVTHTSYVGVEPSADVPDAAQTADGDLQDDASRPRATVLTWLVVAAVGMALL